MRGKRRAARKTLPPSEKRISYTTARRETISQLPTRTNFIPLLLRCEKWRLARAPPSPHRPALPSAPARTPNRQLRPRRHNEYDIPLRHSRQSSHSTPPTLHLRAVMHQCSRRLSAFCGYHTAAARIVASFPQQFFFRCKKEVGIFCQH